MFQTIDHYYDPAYRDLLLQGQGPLGVHRALIELLAGRATPQPRPAVRWRLALMARFTAIQRHIALAPRMKTWSLRSAPAPAPGSFPPRPRKLP